jgi:2-polyprenyl-3-methyl-5-hydroxy-6-metoxy-1,4-benzoquinol methylase
MTQASLANISESVGDVIRSEPCPRCYLCQTAGEMLYEGMRDRLFGAPGEWNLRRCPNSDCGLLWLDPMPLETDIGKAYKGYFTHADFERAIASTTQVRPPFYRRAAMLVRSAYLAHRYNYGDGVGKRLRWLLALPIVLSRIECDSLDIPMRYLAVSRKGRMLDVGCGNGSVLKLAQELGWNAEGVDFDAQAVDAARRKGLSVRTGSLSGQHYSEESFDLVLMSHVLEHVHDPLDTLGEIKRVLRTGGTLVVTTPNADSWGHRHFGSSYVSLEPPRHLQIFNGNTLTAVANRAGFAQSTVSSTLRTTPFVFFQSRLIRAHGRGNMMGAWTRADVNYGRAALAVEMLMGTWNRLAADELLLETRK